MQCDSRVTGWCLHAWMKEDIAVPQHHVDKWTDGRRHQRPQMDSRMTNNPLKAAQRRQMAFGQGRGTAAQLGCCNWTT